MLLQTLAKGHRMKVKIDTKEVFHVITIEEKDLTAIMAATFMEIVTKKQLDNRLSLVLNFSHVEDIDIAFMETLQQLHEVQVANNKSFVVCCMGNSLQQKLGIDKAFDRFNITPTESEAWDIVQMEEIERELGMD